MAICIYQQLNLKNKINKQEQKQTHRSREYCDGCQMGGGWGDE